MKTVLITGADRGVGYCLCECFLEGGYTVISNVLVSTHDGEQYFATATSEFVPNIGSSFGYNIINSDLF